MEKCIVSVGAEEVMYLLILCYMYLCPIAIINILYLSFSYHLQMGRGVSGTMFVLKDHSHHVRYLNCMNIN